MGRALTINDLFHIERLSHVVVSPDGKRCWLTTKKIDLEKNESSTHNYRMELADSKQIPVILNEKGASDIVFSRDGRFIFFAAGGQIWRANADGSNPKVLTHGQGGASKPVVSPDGDRVLFARSVFMNPTVQEDYDKTGVEPELAAIYGAVHPKAKVRIADRLMYRHWDSWCENKRSHLFIVETETGKMVDLTPFDADVPPIALESACDYDFSPDGRHIAFVMNPDQVVARSTNNSIYLMEIDGMVPGKPVRISDTDGCDTAPMFLNDSEIAYSSMLTPGYEADAPCLKVYHLKTKETRLYLESFERGIESWVQTAPGKLLFKAQDFAHTALFTLDLNTGKVEQLTSGRTYSKFAYGGGHILACVEALNAPLECVELSDLHAFEPLISMGSERLSNESVRYLTHFGAVLDGVELDRGQCTHFQYKEETLEGYVVLPPGFDPARKYPLILLIHGGPQGAFLDQFHYRWNVEMFAAQGAIVGFCNPHGSTGYGHALTRAISRHWGDDCPNAIMAFVDHLLREFPQIDPDRLTAAGASFGGYMINWLMGHTDRFKALVSHDGIFNTEMSGYVTDELWFNEYEFGGKPYDEEAAARCARFSPHKFVKNFKTPTLVIQGEQDFRCFTSEGIALFTALQYMGVKSRLIYFPNEGHWVLDPADSAVWYHEVVSWLMTDHT